jgi:hypothetical protein
MTVDFLEAHDFALEIFQSFQCFQTDPNFGRAATENIYVDDGKAVRDKSLLVGTLHANRWQNYHRSKHRLRS